jgi:glycosyltransferase involved in cell wall biosynthesis
VSVVVPVWNPGPNLNRCIESLLGQDLPADRYEIVLVDDGSTDGTAQRLDALAAAHPGLIRVLHTPNSGWPGKPRNVGIEAARGTYVHLVDNDDTLPSYALSTMYEAGRAAGADVVLGRPASDFRGLNHSIYRRTIPTCVLTDFPDLTETLTPHKMFRREFLLEHGVRFPEGPVPLEDQMFVMRAYLHAKAITVLCDRPYYFYLRRIGSGRNAGDRAIDPVLQCAATEQVIDIVEGLVAEPALRDRLLRRFYRINLLARVAEQSYIDSDDEWRRALVAEIRRVITTRLTPEARAGAGAANRIQAHLVIADDLAALATLAGHYRAITVRAAAAQAQWRDSVLYLDVDAALLLGEEALRCDRVGDGWALPATLAPSVPVEDRLLDPVRDLPDAEVSLVSRVSAVSFGSDEGLQVAVDDEGVIRVRGRVAIDPATALAGRALDDGLWDVRLRLRYAGFNRAAALRIAAEAAAGLQPLITPDGRTVLPYVPEGSQSLLLDVGQWHASLARTLARSAALELTGRRRLAVSLDVFCDAREQPLVQLALQPQDATSGGVVVCDGALHPAENSARAELRLPRLRDDGTWRCWLRVADAGAGPAAELPWLLRTAGGQVRLERMPDPVPDAATAVA